MIIRKVVVVVAVVVVQSLVDLCPLALHDINLLVALCSFLILVSLDL